MVELQSPKLMVEVRFLVGPHKIASAILCVPKEAPCGTSAEESKGISVIFEKFIFVKNRNAVLTV